MAGWPDTASFADRHVATMDLKRALKKRLDLPSTALNDAAQEIEAKCLAASSSKEEYAKLVKDQEDKIGQAQQQIAEEEEEAADLPATTGCSEKAKAEAKAIGPYMATYHAHSFNSIVHFITSPPQPAPGAVLKVVVVSSQLSPHDIIHEARLLQRLAGNPHIIPLLGTDNLAGGVFSLRLPYLRYDLGSLAAAGRLSPVQARRHLRSLLCALEAAHAQGVIHRDVKPSNVLMAHPDGPALLADFGIAWAADLRGAEGCAEPAGAKITDVGTGAYRPPELLFGCTDYGTKLDMWAAGCTVGEVLMGGGKTLFDAGPVSREDFLGSDLALINSVFRKLGTPTDKSWPEATRFRDWGKVVFKEFPAIPWEEIMPGMQKDSVDLVSKLVTYESGSRLSATEALQKSYFKDGHAS